MRESEKKGKILISKKMCWGSEEFQDKTDNLRKGLKKKKYDDTSRKITAQSNLRT